jgi:hypothetical protein
MSATGSFVGREETDVGGIASAPPADVVADARLVWIAETVSMSFMY